MSNMYVPKWGIKYELQATEDVTKELFYYGTGWISTRTSRINEAA